MKRLRTPWFAVVGGALLLILTVSSAFGADPVDADAPRGQSVAAFVHELIFGANDESEDPPADEEESQEDGADDVDDADDVDEEPDESEDGEEGEESENGDSDDAESHGACVSEVAQDKEAVGGANENHGGAVSEAARETCWETDDTDEVTDPEDEDVEEEDVEEEDESAEDEDKNHGECVSEVARDKAASAESGEKNHGKVVSLAARITCWEDGDEAEETEGTDESVSETDEDALTAHEQREADRAARRAEREAAKAERKANRESGGGHGNGRGGGRP